MSHLHSKRGSSHSPAIASRCARPVWRLRSRSVGSYWKPARLACTWEVGKELTAGEWKHVVVDLGKTVLEPSIGASEVLGAGFVVNTESVWRLDRISYSNSRDQEGWEEK